jgi:SPP1 gp7 family putative phage head morphogenesis protein
MKRPELSEPIERQLREIFYQIIFQPLMAVIHETTVAHKLENTGEDELKKALRTGQMEYDAGVFHGRTSGAIGATLRKLGATFDKRAKVYRLEADKVPTWVKGEATVWKAAAKRVNLELSKTLGYIESSLDQAVDRHEVDASKLVRSAASQFQDVAKRLEIAPDLSEGSLGRIATDYTQNMKLWIQKFSKESIQELRGVVEENAREGYRFDNLMDQIQNRYEVTKTKAKFLARQETSIFMSTFRANKFKEAGVRKYQWSTAHDSRVRDRHADLDGTVQFYDSPPIVDQRTGRRGNPGFDYNCRCVDIPLVEKLQEAA